MTHVLCLKWGTKYSADYVNKLYWGVRRNTATPFEFICYTDDPKGIIPEVRCRWFAPGRPLEGWWNKVRFFSPEIGIADRILYLDLDTVITGPIDELLGFGGTFAILRDLYQHAANPHSTAFGSGVMSWRGGWGHHVWTEFTMRPEQWQRLGGDQQYLMRVIPIADVTFWQDYLKQHKVCSYKANIRDSGGKVPVGTSVVNFHGQPRPHEVADLQWMRDYWRTGA